MNKILAFTLFLAATAQAAFFPINKGMVNQTSVITADATLQTLVASSNQAMLFEGSTRDSVRFPSAQLLPMDWWYEIINNTSSDVEAYDGSGALIATTNVGRVGRYILKDTASPAGTWKFTQAAAPIDIPTNFDSLYYRKTEHVGSTSGVPDAGKPIVLNGSGLVDNSMLPSSAVSGWGTAGNAGINAATDFLGTIDGNDLVLRTNNTERFRVTSAGVYDTNLSAGVAYTDSSGILDVSSLTASRAMVTDGSGVPVTATVTATEISHVGGASSNLQAQIDLLQPAGDYITDLTGDVTAAGPGSVAATVALVGGETAADVATSVTDTQAATDATSNSTIVKRDGSGNFSATTITAALAGNATTSTALAADPTDCSAGQKATGIAANGNLTCSAVSLSADVSNVLPIANGGTGFATSTQNSVLLGNGISPFQGVAPGTNGNVLTSNGTTWTSAAAPSGAAGDVRMIVVSFAGASEEAACTGSPCTLYQNLDDEGNADYSVTRSTTGTYSLVIPGSRCTSIPTCAVTLKNSAALVVDLGAASTTDVPIVTKNLSGTGVDGTGSAVCGCPR